MSLAALLLTLAAVPQDNARADNLPSIQVEDIEGREWWTVQARGVTVENLVSTIARRSGRQLDGLPPRARAVIVNAHLQRRSLEQVLEYTLGSVGLDYELHRDAIFVRLVAPTEATQQELIDNATVAWLRATTRFPGYPSAPSARLAQGELAEMRGMMTAANANYQTLIEEYPASKAASEALMRSGRIYKRLEDWQSASTQFRELASRTEHNEYQAPARLELARCFVERGNPESARYLLDALDEEFPTTDPLVRTERMLVRAQILNDLGEYLQTLKVLDPSSRQFDPLSGREMLRIRAVAMEGLQMYGDAGRAWLLYARDAEPDARSQALENAARLALADGDEMGVVFIYKEAERESLTPQTIEYWKQARHRLGLEDAGLEGATSEERIVAGESLLIEGKIDLASAIFEPLFQGRGALPEPMAARAAVGWANCVADRDGLETAIELLGGLRASFEDIEATKRLDLGAAQLFEAQDRFAEAIDAYQGKYGGSQ